MQHSPCRCARLLPDFLPSTEKPFYNPKKKTRTPLGRPRAAVDSGRVYIAEYTVRIAFLGSERGPLHFIRQGALGHQLGLAGGDRRPAGDELCHKHLQLVDADVWHHHHVRNFPLAGQLPLAHKRKVLGALKDNGGAQTVEHHPDPCRLQHRLEDVGVAEALLDVLAHPVVALLREHVPQVDRGVAVAGAHDCSIAAVEVLDV
mmetsp:Transcript_35339/g.100037  ORF Transcript_35339/g.100037 Transcript_35339/m.100037 type:complete len:203 (-) Transcript_35339:1330-1938(-)